MRPTKFLRDSREQLGEREAERLFLEDFDISEQKYALTAEICKKQEPILKTIERRDLDIYVGIPFCASRCAYCSFAAMENTRDGELEERYVAALLYEMEQLGDVIAAHRVRSVYIGGVRPLRFPRGSWSECSRRWQNLPGGIYRGGRAAGYDYEGKA